RYHQQQKDEEPDHVTVVHVFLLSRKYSAARAAKRLPRRTTSVAPAAAASRSSFPCPCRDRGGGPVLCAGRMTRRLAQERLILSRGGRKFPWEKEVNGGGNRGRS